MAGRSSFPLENVVVGTRRSRGRGLPAERFVTKHSLPAANRCIMATASVRADSGHEAASVVTGWHLSRYNVGLNQPATAAGANPAAVFSRSRYAMP